MMKILIFLALLAFCLFVLFSKPKTKLFRYRYQIHPWDTSRFFKVEAANQQEADEKAHSRFSCIFALGGTVMTVFYRA